MSWFRPNRTWDVGYPSWDRQMLRPCQSRGFGAVGKWRDGQRGDVAIAVA